MITLHRSFPLFLAASIQIFSSTPAASERSKAALMLFHCSGLVRCISPTPAVQPSLPSAAVAGRSRSKPKGSLRASGSLHAGGPDRQS
jgi:hypothetical protein